MVALTAACPCNAQNTPIDDRLRTLRSALEGALEREADAARFRAAVDAAEHYVAKLGSATERRAAQLVLDGLRRHKAGPFLVAEDLATELFDEVAHQRSRGRPHRMIPALLLLQSRYPTDARVLYCLGEAYGVASPVFDPERAARYFRQLLETLREQTEVATEPIGNAALLATYLPELTRAGLLLEERPTDTSSTLRQQLLDYAETLAGGAPIGLWKLADRRLDRLQDKLRLARRDRDQTRCRELLGAMLELQPVNPVLQHALAELHASIGPAFDPDAAIAGYQAFLELTDPAILGERMEGAEAALYSKDSLLQDLKRFRLSTPRDDLEAQRDLARDLLGELRATNWKHADAQPFLFCPDAKTLRQAIRRIEQQKMRGPQIRLERAVRNRDKFERALRGRRVTPQQRADYEKKRDRALHEIEQYTAELDSLKQWRDCYLRALDGDLELAISEHEALRRAQ